jgi:hypothetical protein
LPVPTVKIWYWVWYQGGCVGEATSAIMALQRLRFLKESLRSVREIVSHDRAGTSKEV